MVSGHDQSLSKIYSISGNASAEDRSKEAVEEKEEEEQTEGKGASFSI